MLWLLGPTPEKKTFDKLISYNDWVLGHFFPE